ncbi:hypothetical protein ACCO45_000755 [Purpureocillium lilacinum]|uniref:Uncharacterized protein n=1 Tax=Purpureocillium lilacinum TaxID=33203 RepID=A0ACC4E536_PURLI
MANWKELGEVPDSEEEDGFGSQEAEAPALPTALANTAEIAPQEDKDIWDVPDSQGEQQSEVQTQLPALPLGAATATPPFDQLPYSSPLSSVPSEHDLPPVDELLLGWGDDEPPAVPEPNQNAEETQPLQYLDASPGPLRTRIEIPIYQSQNRRQEFVDDDQEARQVAVRYERSLRPRKPIQEHPYLLENVQYSNLFKKHGVRPVRVAIESARRHREAMEQDNDFEEESQETTDVAGESQVHFNEPSSSLGAADPFEFPSSSPPKTSPANNRGKDSSRASSPRDPAEANAASREGRTSPDPLASTSHNAQPKPGTRPGKTMQDRQPQTPRADEQPPSLGAIIDISSDNDNGHRLSSKHRHNAHAASSSESSSESDEEVVNTIGRRIRGVLPASWLRLDQQSGRDKLQADIRRNKHRQSPSREIRRGVAQSRPALPGSTAANLFFDDSEESDSERAAAPVSASDWSPVQARLSLVPDATPVPAQDVMSDDDDGSVVEDDRIDAMLPGWTVRKRQLKLPESLKRDPKRIKASGHTPIPRHSKGQRQEKITSHVYRAPASSKPDNPKRKNRKSKKRAGGGQAPRSAPRPTPPRLSILDVLEPNAPCFLNIAARAARRQPGQGRSSPRRKTIQLATRQDQIDAASILHEWREGSIRPRQSVTAAIRSPKQPRQPLQDTSGNGRRKQKAWTSQATSTTRKFVKQISDGGSVTYRPEKPPGKPRSDKPPAAGGVVPRYAAPTRPAQLEMDESDQSRRGAFHARKRVFDRLYRNADLGMPLQASLADIAAEIASSPDLSDSVESTHARSTTPLEPRPANAPRRKLIKPRRVDIEAPEFQRAKEPLPVEYVPEPRPVRPDHGHSKLLGLGPYGTTYTQHFERRRLCQGSGCPPARLLQPGEQVLELGAWDAQVSSELGIVFDFVAEQIEGADAGNMDSSSTAINASMFVLRYLKESLSFTRDNDMKAFAARAIECLASFNSRVDSLVDDRTQAPEARQSIAMRVSDRMLLMALVVLRICGDEPMLSVEQFQAEDLLKRMSKTSMSILRGTGAAPIRKAYDELQSIRVRERGLRDDAFVIQSWVVLMKVLEAAHIPRASFWEVAQDIIIPPSVAASADAENFERSWDFMFNLLPLVEFGDSGVVVSGRRHDVNSDGWGIPQALLKRVFRLYQDNTRQSPSFNDYCRALVGRCHCLIQQWGWRRSAAVVGVIFDFFGSQDLAHLRNEEAYESPRFLEELAGRPVLDVEPGDRCFHIFLKMVGLSIRKLRRSMLRRTYAIWSSPDLRPAVSLIERLVSPENSHKEACLINIRCWSQLARFIVASGEAGTTFRPFNQWRNSFFQQVLRQFSSVAPEIQQQVLALAKDGRQPISEDRINDTIARNKAAIGDVLYSSVAASLDVLTAATDLEGATFSLNTYQLQTIYQQFAAAPPDLDWGTLQAAVTTLGSFLRRVDDFKEEEESQQSESQILNSALADDALETVERVLLRGFFSMARCVMSSRNEKKPNVLTSGSKDKCIESVVSLSARLSARYIKCGNFELSDMFKPGTYGLFVAPPHQLDLHLRRHMTHFVSVLLESGLESWTTSECSLPELWALSLVKPRDYLKYENELAKQLHKSGKDFVPDAVVALGPKPDYVTNRDLFEFAISQMRRSIRDAGPSLRTILLAEHSVTLQRVMEQIKMDLKAVSNDMSSHQGYVAFIRSIVSLIKSHGSEIRPVDNFFYQISNEYSPSTDDPQLQVAGLISYGVRIREGDTRSSQQLFHLLLSNVKFAISNDRLREDVTMLRKGMANQGIVGFVLGKMLPSCVRAAFRHTSAHPLLDIYGEALRILLAKKVVAYELTEADLPHVVSLAHAAIEGIDDWVTDAAVLSATQLHVLRQIVAVLNLLWPQIRVIAASSPSSQAWTRLCNCFELLHQIMTTADDVTSNLVRAGETVTTAGRLFGANTASGAREVRFDSDVKMFTDLIVKDVATGWGSRENRMTTQANNHGGASVKGVPVPAFDAEGVLQDLHERIREWRWWWDEVFGVSSPAVLVDNVVF